MGPVEKQLLFPGETSEITARSRNNSLHQRPFQLKVLFGINMIIEGLFYFFCRIMTCYFSLLQVLLTPFCLTTSVRKMCATVMSVLEKGV